MAKIHTVSWWKKELWKSFSLYIRNRDNYTCVTCGRVGEGSGMHAGHYIPKSVGGLSLYFHEKNVHAQCYHCNINLGGNGRMYERFMLRKYGQATVDELEKLQHSGVRKIDEAEYKRLIAKYQTKVASL